MTAWAFLLLQLAAGRRQKKIVTLIENVEWHLSLGCTDLLLSWRMVGLAAMLNQCRP